MIMFQGVNIGTLTAFSFFILTSCSPKPASEPERAFIVDGGYDRYADVINATVDFAESKGFIFLGKKNELPDSIEFYDDQLYRIDSQILLSKWRERLHVGFYRSGGPISKSSKEVDEMASEYEILARSKGWTYRIDHSNNLNNKLR